MFDYNHSETLSEELAQKLLSNKNLNFKGKFDFETSAVLEDDPLVAKYHSLTITIHPNFRIVIKGSLHQFFNCLMGKYGNYDLFTYKKAIYVLDHFEKILEINTKQMKSHSLEFGHNIIPHIPTNEILDAFILYKAKELSPMRSNSNNSIKGLECYFTEYAVKFYDKALQNNLFYELLRIEKKVTTMRNEFPKGIVLNDLRDILIWERCNDSILNVIDNLLILEPITKSLTTYEQQIYDTCQHPRALKKMDRRERSRKKKDFNSLIENYGTFQIKKNLKELCIGQFNAMINPQS